MYNYIPEPYMPMQIKDAIAGMVPTARDNSVPQLRGTAYVQSPNPDLPPLPHPSDVRQMNSQYAAPDPYADQRRQNILNSNPYRAPQPMGYGGYNPYNRYSSRAMEMKALTEVPNYRVGIELPQGFVPDMRQLPDDFRCSNPAPVEVAPPIYTSPNGASWLLNMAGIQSGQMGGSMYDYSPYQQPMSQPMGGYINKPNCEAPYQFSQPPMYNQQPMQYAPQQPTLVNPQYPNPHIEPPAMHMVQANGMKPMDFGYNPYMPPVAQPQHFSNNVEGAKVSGNILQDFQQPTPTPKEMLGNIGTTNYGLPNYAPIGYGGNTYSYGINPTMQSQGSGYYNVVQSQLIPNIQDNPYDMNPSQAAIDYYNANVGRIYGLINPYEAAKENYARVIGFASAAEMDAEIEFSDRCNAYRRAKMRGLNDKDAEYYVYSIFDKPKEDAIKEQKAIEESRRAYETQVAPFILVKLYDKDGNLLASTEGFKAPPFTPMHQRAYEMEVANIERRGIMRRYQRDYTNQYLYNIALERNYDSMDAMTFFNEGFYMIRMRNDLITLQGQRSHRFKGSYDPVEFKRKLREENPTTYSDRLKLVKDRIKFRMDEELPDSVIRGGRGYMPGGIKLDEDPTKESMDPNRGYLYTFDVANGSMGMMPPILDENEIDRIRFEKFKSSIRGGV